MTVVEIVERERRRLRAIDVAGAVALLVLVTAALLGAGSWALGESRWIALPRATPFLVWLVIAAADAALVVWMARRWRRVLDSRAIAAAIEREQRLRAGALRGVMELGDAHVMARRADRMLSDRLSSAGTTLAPTLRRSGLVRALRAGAVAVLTIALLLVAGPSLSDGLLAIRRPIAAWTGSLLPPLTFDALPPELLRGESLQLSVHATGRRRVRLSARSIGEGWRQLELSVDSATGNARAVIGPVRGDLMLVASDGRSSTDTSLVRVTDRPFVGGVVLRAVYPAYLGRAAEGLPVGEPARVPRGTVVEISGRASTTLSRVQLRSAASVVTLRVSDHSFDGHFRPEQGGRWEWIAQGVQGPIADVPLPLEIDVVPDSAPHVDLVSPATDTLVATTDRVALNVTVTDDHGLSAVELHTARQPARGRKEAPIAQRLVADQGAVWNGAPTVDLASRELRPGDALTIQVVAIDNSPWAQRGVSRELVLRIPSMEERRSLAREAADSAASEAVSAAAAQKSLEQRTDQASRERSRGAQASGTKGAEAGSDREREMSYASAEKARALAQEQRELTDRVDRLREAAKQLEAQLREAAALDSGLARQLREAQDLLRDALTPELLEQMKKLENATRDLSGDESRDALRNLAEMQRRLREQLEKSAEMLKRAAIEGAMETLKDEAQEVADRQKSLADSTGMSDAAKQREGRQLADRSGRLAKDVNQLQQRLDKAGAQAAAPKTASAAREAEASAQQMQQSDARSASERMQQAANDMKDAREQQVAEWKQELTQALDQSIQELLQMAREESSMEDKARSSGRDQSSADQLRGQQSAVKQGVDQTAQRLQKEGQKSSLLSGRSQRALAEAKQRVTQATQQMAEQRGAQQAAGTLGEAADALNRAAASLARDRERANTASSATGFAEMLQQMQEMARRQGSINAQAQGLLPMPGQPSLSAEAQATARMLARQQRQIASQLDEIGDAAGGERAAELAREARQLAEVLDQTRVDAATVARQQQLFRRLLDAGRALEKEEREDDQKREAKSATGDERFDPGSASATGRAGSRFREPTWNELRGLTADERRAVLEYFKRINAEKP